MQAKSTTTSAWHGHTLGHIVIAPWIQSVLAAKPFVPVYCEQHPRHQQKGARRCPPDAQASTCLWAPCTCPCTPGVGVILMPPALGVQRVLSIVVCGLVRYMAYPSNVFGMDTGGATMPSSSLWCHQTSSMHGSRSRRWSAPPGHRKARGRLRRMSRSTCYGLIWAAPAAPWQGNNRMAMAWDVPARTCSFWSCSLKVVSYHCWPGILVCQPHVP